MKNNNLLSILALLSALFIKTNCMQPLTLTQKVKAPRRALPAANPQKIAIDFVDSLDKTERLPCGIGIIHQLEKNLQNFKFFHSDLEGILDAIIDLMVSRIDIPTKGDPADIFKNSFNYSGSSLSPIDKSICSEIYKKLRLRHEHLCIQEYQDHLAKSIPACQDHVDKCDKSQSFIKESNYDRKHKKNLKQRDLALRDLNDEIQSTSTSNDHKAKAQEIRDVIMLFANSEIKNLSSAQIKEMAIDQISEINDFYSLDANTSGNIKSLNPSPNQIKITIDPYTTPNIPSCINTENTKKIYRASNLTKLSRIELAQEKLDEIDFDLQKLNPNQINKEAKLILLRDSRLATLIWAQLNNQ